MVDRLLNSAWPPNVNPPDCFLLSDPEQYPAITGRCVAARGGDGPVLSFGALGGEPDFRSDGVAVAFRPLQV